MAGRIRSIKPEILERKRTAALSHEAWRLFVSMITLADDYGNLIAEPRRLEGAVFWARSTVAPIEEIVVELVTADLINVYESRGCLFAHLTGWSEHQRVDKPGPTKADKPEQGQPVTDIREWLANGSRMARESPGISRPGLDRKGEEGKGSGSIPQSPSAPGVECFDFERVYREVYPRHEGKARGMRAAKRAITTQAKYERWCSAVRNYAAHVAGRATEHIKQFDSFMSVWEEYVDFKPSPQGDLLKPRAAIPPREAVTEDKTGVM